MINNTFEINSEEYFKKENFNSELKNIIQNFWIFICPSMFLVKKNDFFVFKGLGKNIVIKRIGDDKVVVFDNYCKHRGHQIHDKYFGSEETRCPYHGWLYDEDLKLSSLPWNEKCYHINKDSIQLDASVKIKQEDGVIWGYFGDKTNLSDIQYPAKKVSKELKAFESLSSESRSFVISQKKFHWRLIFDNLYDRVHPLFLHRNSIATKVNLNFEAYPNDFSMEGLENYLLSNFDHIGNSKDSNSISLDKNIENMDSDEYLNGHIYPFLHFLTPDGGKTFNYESYIPVDEYTTIVMNFRFVGKKVSKSQHTSFLNEYLSFGSIVLNEDSRAVEYVTEVGKYNKILTYGAHEKPAVGLINLGKKK
jgi:phenylpropionate dioxygenase-like ring-hydroxylating dioxygenase large terminal subunit